ncbi:MULTISPECIES: anti-sigma B factor [Peptoniphilus]|uniref:anti-sigma B factor n=1 Tax=Peptoniphilus TaxID=162289 RepID=UPI0001DAA0E8|nr:MULTISPECIES: anti-sigma B factor [Peptoniphilus]EFI41679.1 hypothetical protein HMPREF0629_00303 [Peptoniphilus sp. oral taxon 386 str. F0131]
MENIYLSIPNKAEYFSSVRLFVSGIMSNLNLDIETVEDIKMAINEGLTIAYELQCNEMINIEIEVTDEKCKVTISEICKEKIERLEQLSLSNTIIECLVDDSYIEDESIIFIINL